MHKTHSTSMILFLGPVRICVSDCSNGSSGASDSLRHCNIRLSWFAEANYKGIYNEAKSLLKDCSWWPFKNNDWKLAYFLCFPFIIHAKIIIGWILCQKIYLCYRLSSQAMMLHQIIISLIKQIIHLNPVCLVLLKLTFLVNRVRRLHLIYLS